MPSRSNIGSAVPTCTDCGYSKPLDAFTPMKGTPYRYGRCKACRAAKARAERAGLVWLPPAPTEFRSAANNRPPGVTEEPTERTCTECGETRAISAFVRIKGTARVYGRCRECRNARARERYHSSPEVRQADIARAARNQAKRLIRLSSSG